MLSLIKHLWYKRKANATSDRAEYHFEMALQGKALKATLSSSFHKSEAERLHRLAGEYYVKASHALDRWYESPLGRIW